MGLRLTEYWASCGGCLVKIAQSLLLFGLTSATKEVATASLDLLRRTKVA